MLYLDLSLLHADSCNFEISNIHEELHLPTRWAIRESEGVVVDIVWQDFCKLHTVNGQHSSQP
jgi:hypothetical protein